MTLVTLSLFCVCFDEFQKGIAGDYVGIIAYISMIFIFYVMKNYLQFQCAQFVNVFSLHERNLNFWTASINETRQVVSRFEFSAFHRHPHSELYSSHPL